MPTPAIILAAGFSKRMGQPKALLTLNDQFFIEVIISQLNAAGFNPIIVVLGADNPEIQKKANLENAQVVLNDNPERGQLSSLQCGLRNISGDHPGALITLVDHALVRVETYRAMHNEIINNSQKILLPLYNARRGHPVYFPKQIFEDLFDAHPEKGARQVVRQNQSIIEEIAVDDPAIRYDIDTPEIYNHLVKKKS